MPVSRWEWMAWLGLLFLPVLVLFKRVPAEVAVGITVIVALTIAIRKRDFSWLSQWWLYAAAVLSLFLLVLSLFSYNPGESALNAILAFRWPVYAAGLAWLLLKRPTWLAHFERAVLVVIAFIVADTALQYLAGTDVFGHVPFGLTRLTGPFNHPLVGSLTDRIWFIGLAALWLLALRKSLGWAIAALMAASAVGALFMFITGERAALLTFLLGTAVVFLGVLISYPRSRKRLIALGVVAGLVVTGLAITQKKMVGRSIDSTVHTIVNFDQTIYGLIARTAVDEFLEHPLTGVGARQFRHYCNHMMPNNLHEFRSKFGVSGCAWHPHNFYTGMLAEGGIFSFIAFVVMVFLIFYALGRQAFSEKNVPVMAFFGWAVLLTSFWPLQSGMEYFNGWAAAVMWTGVGWALARTKLPLSAK